VSMAACMRLPGDAGIGCGTRNACAAWPRVAVSALPSMTEGVEKDACTSTMANSNDGMVVQ